MVIMRVFSAVVKAVALAIMFLPRYTCIPLHYRPLPNKMSSLYHNTGACSQHQMESCLDAISMTMEGNKDEVRSVRQRAGPGACWYTKVNDMQLSEVEADTQTIAARRGCSVISKFKARLKRDAMVEVGLSAGCLRYLWDPDVPACPCADPCPKFGLINLSILNTRAAPQQTLHRVTRYLNTPYTSEVVLFWQLLPSYILPNIHKTNFSHSFAMAEMQMESEEVLKARFEELNVLENEFDDVEIEISRWSCFK